MQKIVILDHYSQVPGEQGNNRFIYLAELLIRSGYHVEIVTTTFSHKTKLQRELKNIDVNHLNYSFTFLYEPGYKKNISLTRMFSHGIFGKNLTRYLIDNKDKIDLLYVAIPSISIGIAATRFAKKYKIPVIIDIQDIWPEAFKLIFKVPVVSDIIYFPLYKAANFIYKRADKIVAVSTTYLKRGLSVNRKDKDGLVVFLGTDLPTFDKYAIENKIEKPEHEVWVAYAGTLGHSYNINIILQALYLLKEKGYKTIVFKIMGDGPLLQDFKAAALNLGIKCDFLGRVNYNKMVGYLVASDIAVNPISKGAAQSIINKHADYAAAGLPVVSTQESSEYVELIEKYKCGINCNAEDVTQVADAIEHLLLDKELKLEMGKNHRIMAEEKFDRNHTYLAIVRLIKEITGG